MPSKKRLTSGTSSSLSKASASSSTKVSRLSNDNTISWSTNRPRPCLMSSANLPGVATTTSAPPPLRNEEMHLCKGTPPMVNAHFMADVPLTNSSHSLAICEDNSRDGAMITTRGEAGPRFVGISRGFSSNRCARGIIYARVLPVAVGELTIASRPLTRGPQALSWAGSGVFMLCAARLSRTVSGRPSQQVAAAAFFVFFFELGLVPCFLFSLSSLVELSG
mmetsp:Transcript_27154/g.82294  ORF Transcript_27154/g.82294 Transcript_27154/m.82294 type:complete len:221 (+) Transcript_27154:1093-1755(+)